MMFEVFSMIDGCSDGTTATDDRKISKQEWAAMLSATSEAGVTWAPFVRLKNVCEDDFDQIDANGKGVVLLSEFCKWIEDGEIATGSDLGKELAVGDDR